MIIYNNQIPSSHFVRKTAQIIPEQSLNETVSVFEDAIPYIRCAIQSTIQHEAAHRDDESQRDESILKQKQSKPGYPFTDLAKASQVVPFDRFTADSRAEPIAESAEENCDALLPPEMSGNVASVNLTQLFEEAKSAAKIDPQYLQSVKAGHLPPEAQGMYLMQDRSDRSVDELIKLKQSRGNVHVDEHNNLWIDVRKIVAPFLTKDQQQDVKPPTYQGASDGAVQPDLPGVSQQPPQGIQAVPGTGSIPTVPARESR